MKKIGYTLSVILLLFSCSFANAGEVEAVFDGALYKEIFSERATESLGRPWLKVSVYTLNESFEEAIRKLRSQGWNLQETDIEGQRQKYREVTNQQKETKTSHDIALFEPPVGIILPFDVLGFRQISGLNNKKERLFLETHWYDETRKEWIPKTTVTFITLSAEPQMEKQPAAPAQQGTVQTQNVPAQNVPVENVQVGNDVETPREQIIPEEKMPEVNVPAKKPPEKKTPEVKVPAKIPQEKVKTKLK